MQLLYQRIERQLASSPLGTLPIEELVTKLCAEPLVPTTDYKTVAEEIRRWPDRFRLVDPWHCQASSFPARNRRVREAGVASWSTGSAQAETGMWAVLVEAVVAERATVPLRERPRQIADHLRESVLHLARVLDKESLRALARWTRLAGSGVDTGGRVTPV